MFFARDSNGSLTIQVPNLTATSDRLTVSGGTGGAATLSHGGTWTNASSRAFKTGFLEIDPLDVLERVVALSITRWTYRDSAEGEHIGPMAEDFKAAFDLAGNGQSIATVDADGVALAAIQGLNQKLEAENAALRSESGELRARLDRLEALLGEQLGDRR
ncbi:MAG: tail fiber domain-containing protein [Rhodanobacteraceae bacterium]|nr:tail fiber domain-containing protein [Rhodanobacteraceae bacterium]